MDYIHALHAQGKKSHEHFGWLIYLGLFNILLGVLAITFSNLATLAAVMYLGWLFILSGAATIYFAFQLHKIGGHWSLLFFGILAIVCGALLLIDPMNNGMVLTLFIMIFILTSGLMSLLSCFFDPHPHRGWVFFGGVISIICAWVIYTQWPVSGTWVPGTFLGVYLIVHGSTQVQIGLGGRHILKTAHKNSAVKTA
jgi:uncharacterized membrane protein HdeD (DUF308 family)